MARWPALLEGKTGQNFHGSNPVNKHTTWLLRIGRMVAKNN